MTTEDTEDKMTELVAEFKVLVEEVKNLTEVVRGHTDRIYGLEGELDNVRDMIFLLENKIP